MASYILNKLAPAETDRIVTSWKLQKLVYYFQAWSPFGMKESFFLSAWKLGLMARCVRTFTSSIGGHLRAGDIQGPDALDETGVETIDAVLDFYGDKTGRYLSDLTHMERPWIEARGDTPSGIRPSGDFKGSYESEYYGAL